MEYAQSIQIDIYCTHWILQHNAPSLDFSVIYGKSGRDRMSIEARSSIPLFELHMNGTESLLMENKNSKRFIVGLVSSTASDGILPLYARLSGSEDWTQAIPPACLPGTKGY